MLPLTRPEPGDGASVMQSTLAVVGAKNDSTKAKKGTKTIRMENACWLAQASTKCFHKLMVMGVS